ncbi:three component ABC system middle component [Paenibacillus amylolyticus]|uniref:three component ABC system middle component n=1 Tax=Paenibacillus amylolyticus TaxID=1451 RepID=UPI000FDA51B0|nr:three component ABC system middle component [Paenibacillus amylolyticus]
MSLKHIKNLSLNPYTMSKIIQNFIEGYGSPVEFKLLFYVLPIILSKDARARLIKARKTSRMDTIFKKKEGYRDYEKLKLSPQSHISGFLERYSELKDLTKTVVIILVNEEKISIGNSVILIKKDNYSKYKNLNINELLRSAFYLGVVFKSCSIEELEYYLGVRSN